MQARAAARAAEAGNAAPAPVEAAADEKVLDFSLDEVREARLVPVIDFKGRPFVPQGAAESGTRVHEEANGGRTT